METNKFQFQNDLPITEIIALYGTQAQYHAALVAGRWPEGFGRSDFGHTGHRTFVRRVACS